jgi:hypothetical protein
MLYFQLSIEEQKFLQKYRTPLTRVYFILQLAYFKLKQQFFVFNLNEVVEDVKYLQQVYFEEEDLPLKGIISKPIRLDQQQVILELMKYRIVDKNIRKQLFERACQLATISASPVLIFRDLLNWVEQKRIILPKYTIMQRDIISKALTLERQRLEALITQLLTQEHAIQIDYLITEKIEHHYGLTWIQQEAPNFNPHSIRKEIGRKQLLEPLFQIAQPLLKKLEIANENINYYASLANHYTVGELRQFKGGMHYVFILSYIHHRYQICNDFLAEAFNYYVRK